MVSVAGVTDTQTDKRTDRQTNSTDQYTLRKRPSGFSQSKETETDGWMDERTDGWTDRGVFQYLPSRTSGAAGDKN